MSANLTSEELEAFEACASVEEWERLCGEAKKKRNGAYPDDWWPQMKVSGRMDRIMARFGGSSELEAFAIDKDGNRRRLV